MKTPSIDKKDGLWKRGIFKNTEVLKKHGILMGFLKRHRSLSVMANLTKTTVEKVNDLDL